MGKKGYKEYESGRATFGATTTVTIESLHLLKALNGCTMGDVLALLLKEFGSKMVHLMQPWKYKPKEDPGFVKAYNDLLDLQRKLDIGRVNEVLNMLLINYLCQLIQGSGGLTRFPKHKDTDEASLGLDTTSQEASLKDCTTKAPEIHSELPVSQPASTVNSPIVPLLSADLQEHEPVPPSEFHNIKQEPVAPSMDLDYTEGGLLDCSPFPGSEIDTKDIDEAILDHDTLILQCESEDAEIVQKGEDMSTAEVVLPAGEQVLLTAQSQVFPTHIVVKSEELDATAETNKDEAKARSSDRHDPKDVCRLTNPQICTESIKSKKPEVSIECTVCGTKFTRASSLISHEKTQGHSGRRPFQCQTCNEGFHTSTLLKRHMKTHLIGDKPYKCPVCGKGFTRHQSMIDHQPIHTGLKAYKCQICQKAFTQKSTLTAHQRVHTGEMPSQCNVCGKSFRRQGILNLHMGTHTGIKPFKCDVCGRRFTWPTDLTRHQKVHTERQLYVCAICGKTYSWQNDLRRHEALHKGERPYSCEDCGKGFMTVNELAMHKRTHSGARNYNCPICDRTFLRPSDVDRHQRTHTGKS